MPTYKLYTNPYMYIYIDFRKLKKEITLIGLNDHKMNIGT